MSDTLQGAPVEDFVAGVPSGPGGGNRRLLVIVAAVAGVLVLGAAAYFLFLSGGGTDEQLGSVPSAQPTQPSQPGAKGNNGQNVPKHVTDNFKVGVNPFVPLPAEQPVAAPGDDPADGTTDTGTDPGTTGTTPTDPTTTTPPTDTSLTTYEVFLKSVNAGKDSAVLTVNGTKYTVSAGDNFPDQAKGPLKLVGVTDNAARIQFGSGMILTLDVGHGTSFIG